MKHSVFIALMAGVVLSGCSVAPHNAYDESKAPENRQFYTGIAGFKQYIKDTDYLSNKENQTMCEAYLFAMLENHDANRDSELAPFRKACAGQSKNMLEQLDALKQTP